MNRKGQIGVGALLIVAVAIIVGAVLLQAAAPDVGVVSQKRGVAASTQVTWPSNTTALTLQGQAVESFVAYNDSNVVIAAANYTVTNRVLSNGALISTVIGVGANPYEGLPVNVSYTYEPFGYATDAGSRAVIQLVLIFGALAIAVVALVPTLRSGLIEMIGG